MNIALLYGKQLVRTMKTTILFILPFLAWLSACSSLLVPSWFDGSVDTQNVSYATDDHISVYAENLKIDDRFIVFDVQVVNLATIPVLIEAESMLLIVSELFGENYTGRTVVREPLPVRQLQRHLERSIRSANTGNFLIGLLGATLVAYDATRFAGGVAEASTGRGVVMRSQNEDMAIAATLAGLGVAGNLTNNSLYRLREELAQIDGYYLYSCEVPPGQSVRGMVYFDACAGLNYRLVVPVNGSEFVFDFRKAKQAELVRLRATAAH